MSITTIFLFIYPTVLFLFLAITLKKDLYNIIFEPHHIYKLHKMIKKINFMINRPYDEDFIKYSYKEYLVVENTHTHKKQKVCILPAYHKPSIEAEKNNEYKIFFFDKNNDFYVLETKQNFNKEYLITLYKNDEINTQILTENILVNIFNKTYLSYKKIKEKYQ